MQGCRTAIKSGAHQQVACRISWDDPVIPGDAQIYGKRRFEYWSVLRARVNALGASALLMCCVMQVLVACIVHRRQLSSGVLSPAQLQLHVSEASVYRVLAGQQTHWHSLHAWRVWLWQLVSCPLPSHYDMLFWPDPPCIRM